MYNMNTYSLYAQKASELLTNTHFKKF